MLDANSAFSSNSKINRMNTNAELSNLTPGPSSVAETPNRIGLFSSLEDSGTDCPVAYYGEGVVIVNN
jgi:hypothetical protein